MKAKSKKEEVVILDVWSLRKNHKLPCTKCDETAKDEYTRKELIKHLIKVHNWEPSAAKSAFKEVKPKDGQKII
jgi:uncharacterized C2H2 Zn-finger protein